MPKVETGSGSKVVVVTMDQGEIDGPRKVCGVVYRQSRDAQVHLDDRESQVEGDSQPRHSERPHSNHSSLFR